MTKQRSNRGGFSRKNWVFFGFLSIVSIFVSIVKSETTTVNYQVSSSGDDTYSSQQFQFTHATSMRIGYADREPVPFSMCGMRFTNVQIPKGALVTDARLKLMAFDYDPESTVYGVLHGEDADNPPGFYGRFIANANKTQKSVIWDILDVWDDSKWYTGPDISAIVQSIINRPGWSAGNSMVVLYSNRKTQGKYRNICSYDLPAHICGPKLQITYGIPPQGDFEPDGDVDLNDLALLAQTWGTEDGDDNWNPACDLYSDGVIDIFDLEILADNWLSVM